MSYEPRIPWSEGAERAVLGAMVLSDVARVQVCWLRSAMFFQPAHKMVFQALRWLERQRLEVDLVTLRDALASKGLLGEVGGTEYLIQLTESCATATNAEHYARIVRDKWWMRELQGRCEKFLADQLFDPGTTAAEKVGIASGIADGLRDSGESEFGPGSVFELSDDVKPGIRTGLVCIDLESPAGGLYPDAPNYFAGRQGAGKTDLLVQVALAELRRGGSVLFQSWELPCEKVVRRFMRHMCGEDSKTRAADRGNDEKWAEAEQEFGSFDLRIWDASSNEYAVEAFCDRVVAANAKSRIDLVCVDYIQLFGSEVVKPRDGNKTPVMEQAERVVRATNLRLGNVWLLASQVTKADGEMYTANSQEIEKGASLVLFLIKKGEKEWELHCKKNRDGVGGWTVPLTYDQHLRTFGYTAPPIQASETSRMLAREYDPFAGEK